MRTASGTVHFCCSACGSCCSSAVYCSLTRCQVYGLLLQWLCNAGSSVPRTASAAVLCCCPTSRAAKPSATCSTLQQ